MPKYLRGLVEFIDLTLSVLLWVGFMGPVILNVFILLNLTISDILYAHYQDILLYVF